MTQLSSTPVTLISAQPIFNPLISLLNQSFSSCSLRALDSERNDLQDNQLLVIDCNSLSPTQIHHILSSYADTKVSFCSALVNLPVQSEFAILAQWPQIRGMFSPGVEDALLIRGLNDICKGGLWIPRHITRELLERYRHPPQISVDKECLTRRELQILQHLASGLTNEEIAAETQISKHTVKSHLYNAFRKLDVSNRLQASNWIKTQLL